jgi:hypothetical protein
MTATATETLAPGTVVRAPLYRNGQPVGRPRRGIVLRTFASDGNPKSGYLVWFYTLGAAHKDGQGDTSTVGLVFPREAERVGTVADMGDRVLANAGKGLRDWPTGRQAWNEIYRVYVARKRAAAQA